MIVQEVPSSSASFLTGRRPRGDGRGEGSGEKAQGRRLRGEASVGSPHSGSFRCFYVELLGGPQGLSGAQARPALADWRLTDGVREAPDFSGSDGALTLLSFFLLGYFIFPEEKNRKEQ